ncbi:Coatomer, gamma subunit [Rhizoclosmatium globosum]|uniref:Coatomer subunit gamma n=1 Tax=Rhizoclosmatium globosum TaxID=329046 RepID=A0A1Y2CCJ7_9FUNG|nr:Coatomer, gamma subunit [Rhizoclosmatium globosum]|eukprot:ORY44762.1 Coatomer, gamma subunit [Rhizoclosmatium globosum]
MSLKRDDESDQSLYANLDKSTVLQEARVFNETPINARKCRATLTKILYLIYQSERLQTKEATETFFSITKLFQSQDIPLRQAVYLLIKELSTVAEDVIMVTASLSKDLTAKSEISKANAIRALCKITDASMIQGIERFLKQAIVDKNHAISSAALVSSLHLFGNSKDVVRRWANEVQESVNSKGGITQYHALGLLYQIRQHDRMAVIKLVQSLSRGTLRSPLAYCMLVRYTAKIMDEEEGNRAMYESLEGWLRHRNEMVVYEAARAICNMRDVTPKELFPAVSALQLMLVFAAIRTLNKLALSNPASVAPCNLDMENLITDTNRSIATYAITTLLKTGNEASVDRLMKQITGFMSEISDDFKIIVVDAIRSLCLKFPAKQGVMINFLSNILRDEGGYEFKRSIVEAIFDIIYHIPEAKEYALSHLCEFIEDCEFTKLAVRILHLLGVEGPKSATPSKFIRYIYNRIILENATVKAAAVSAMGHFAVEVPELRERIRVLLTRALDDNDDEVRDRETFSWPTLENGLVNYLAHPELQRAPFDIAAIPTVTRCVAAPGSADAQRAYAAAMEKIPELAMLGDIFKSSKPVELTESETEYVVSFNCRNTINDVVLENVSVAMTVEATTTSSQPTCHWREPWRPSTRIRCPRNIYVVYKRNSNVTPVATFGNTLKFVVKDCDPATGEADEEGYEDEYLLEDLELTTADYIQPTFVSDFGRTWEQVGQQHEMVEAFELSAITSVKDAVTKIIDILGMEACDGSYSVKDKATTHTLLLAGMFVGGIGALVRCRMAYDASSGVTLEIACRCEDPEVCERIVNSIV